MSRSQGKAKRGARGRAPDDSWSAAWSAHVDGLGDFADRRERGRCYLIEGAVLELQVERCRISAHVQGSRVYRPTIVVQPLAEPVRAGLRELACADGCSRRDLLRAALATPQCGMLPRLRELTMVCTCPDHLRWTRGPCKHIFAALYAFGRRLDDEPELLFVLRGVEPDELLRARRRAARIVAPRVTAPRRVRVAARRVRRAELRALGVPARTIDGWIDQGILLRTAERGVYRRTAAVERRLAARGSAGL